MSSNKSTRRHARLLKKAQDRKARRNGLQAAGTGKPLVENLEQRMLLSTIGVVSGDLQYNAAAGETNALTSWNDGTDYYFRDTAGTIVNPGDGWVQDTAGVQYHHAIAGFGITSITISLGDMNDTAYVLSPNVPATVDGGTGTNTLTADNTVNAWSVTGANSGSVGNIAFTNFQNLTGGTSSDTFTLGAAGTLSGNIDGGAGTNTLVQADGTNAWGITGANSGTVTDLTGTWSNIQNLTGGTGNDTFTIGSGATLGGNIDGGAGTNSLVQADGTNAWGITGANSGTVTDLTGTWSNIQNLTGGTGADTFTLGAAGTLSGNIAGGAGTDTLVQTDGTNAWGITGANSGTVTDLTGTWSSIENLTGGTGNDTFTIGAGGSLSGNIDGGAGTNTLAHASGTNAWNITGANSGTVTDLTGTWSNIQNLTGGSGADTFTIGSGATLGGNIDGGLGSNTLAQTDGANTWVVTNAGTSTVTDLTGTWTNIQNLIGGTGVDTFDVQSTVGTLNINAGAGNDIINVSSDAPADAGNLDGIGGALTIDAGSGSNTLNVVDKTGASGAGSVVITSGSISGLAGLTHNQTINYSASGGAFNGGVNITTTDQADTVSVTSVRSDAITTLKTGLGADAITVTNGGDLSGFGYYSGSDPLLHVDSGNTGGGDTLYINGQGMGDDSVYVDMDRVVTAGATGGVVWGELGWAVNVDREGVSNFNFSGGVTVRTSDSQDAHVYAQSTHTGEPVTVNAGNITNDQFEVGSGYTVPGTGTMDNILGAVALNGNGGTDSLIFRDGGDTTVNTYTLTSTTLARTGVATVTYGTMETLAIFGSSNGAAGDTYNVNSTHSGTPVVITAGTQNDTVNIAAGDLTTIASDVTVHGGGGTDTVSVDDSLSLTGNTYTINGQAGTVVRDDLSMTLTFGLDVEHFTLASGVGSDTYFVTPSSTADYSLDAHVGIGDTLNVDAKGQLAPTWVTPNSPIFFNAGSYKNIVHTNFETVNVTDPTGGVVINGTGGNDTIVWHSTSATGGYYTLNGVDSAPYTGVTQVTVNGGGGDDVITLINPPDALFAPVGGIFINGGVGTNSSLIMQGGSAANYMEVYDLGPATDEGTITFSWGNSVVQTVNFTGLAPITDDVVAQTLTVNGTDGANTLAIADDTAGGVNRIKVSVDSYEPISFQNKTNLVLNGGLSSGDIGDTFTVDYSVVPTDLKTVAINAGTGDDTINVTATALGVTTSIDAGLDDDDITLGAGTNDLGGLLGPIVVDSGDANSTDTLAINGASDLVPDVITVDTGAGKISGDLGWDVTIIRGADFHNFSGGITLTTGALGDTVNVQSTFTGETLTVNGGAGDDTMIVNPSAQAAGFLGSTVTFNGQGGTNTLIYQGSGLDDTFSVASSGTVTLTGNAGVLTSGVEGLILAGLDGDDTFAVAATSPYTTIRLEGGDPSGSDSATLTGTGGGDTIGLDLSTGDVTGLGGTITLSGVETLTINGNGGADTLNVTQVGAVSELKNVTLTVTAATSSNLNATGTAGDDTIAVSPTAAGAGSFQAQAGPNVVYSGFDGGAFTVNGGAGTDVLAVYGSAGNDTATSAANVITMRGGAVTLGTGLDRIEVYGLAGDDTINMTNLGVSVNIYGGEGNDTLTGTAQADYIDGGAGNDVINGLAGNDTLLGGDGNDTITGGTGVDLILGGADSDTINWASGDGADTIEGGDGQDVLNVTGTAGADTVSLTGNGVRVTVTANGTSLDTAQFEQINVNAGAGADTLTVNDLSGTGVALVNLDLGAGDASVDAVTVVGTAGDDAIEVSPTGVITGLPAEVVLSNAGSGADTLTVNGGTGVATLSVTGTAATVTVNTSANTISNAGVAPITYQNMENISVAAGTATTLAVSNSTLYTVTPGDSDDEGTIETSTVDVSFSEFGSGSTLNLTGTAGADALTVNGSGANDTFAVSAAGAVTQTGLATITTGGTVESLTLNGGDGDDTFAVAAGNPYTSIRLNGGDPSASDIAALTGDATAGTVTMDSGAATTTVAGAGLGTVTLTGVEIVNLTTTGTIGVNGTAANDSFTASPYSANGVEFALAGLNTVVNASTTAALTLDPVGGAGTVNGVTVNGTAAGETIGIALGAPTAVTVGSYKSLNVVTADTSSLTVNGQEGVDTFNVTGSAGPALIVEGGSPTAVGAGDILDVATAGGTTVNQGTTGDSGQVVSTNGTVNFVAIEGVQLHTAVAAGLTINGTNGDDAIDQTGTVVTVNNGAPVTMVSGYNALTLNGGNGDDVFNVNPATLLGTVATFTVNGGDPSASDKLIVNGRSATTDAINFAPTAADAGSVTITGFTGVGFTTVEQVTINGQGGGDTVAFTTPVSSTITLTPGATVDSGGVQVNSLVPVSFENIGSTGTVQFAQTGGGRGGTLIYEGTGNDDAFGVTAAGVISLNSQVNVTDAGAGVSAVTLDGGEGDDAFAVTNGYAYAGGIRLEGGDPSGSDSATLTTDAAGATAIVVNLNSGTVTGVGASTVTLSGVENVTVNGTVGADTAAVNQAGMVSEIENLTLNLDTSSASAVTLTGSAGDENFDVSPISATRTVTVVGGVTIDATQGSGAFTVDPGAGSDVVTVHGTASGETIAVNRVASTVLVGALKTVTLSAANTESLVVSAGAGDDTIAVTGAAGIPLIVDGGMPSGSDTLTVATSGAASVTIGATPDSGVVSSVTNGSVAFVGIEAITLTGDAGLTINGTNADNAINQSGGTVSVDDAAPVTFGGGGFTGLTLNGFAGDDVFNVNPATLPAGIATFTVSGGDPTAGDTLIVNGTSGGDAINFLPTSADAGGVAIAGDTTVTFDTTELVVINGLGGVDTLTVTTPAGANTVRYSPAQAADAGAVLVDSLVAMSFENIGSSGTVAMADAAPARSDSLVYDGTANNDAFGITAAGNITLAGHVTLTSAGANAGLSSVTLNGGDGDDTFAVAAGNPYTSIRLNGGDPSASDIAALTGDATAGTVTMDSGAATTTVAGAGLGTVTLTGVEIVNLTTTGTIGVNGTAANDSFTASPYSANGVEFALAGLNTVVNASTTAALTLDPVGGAGTVNGVTVNGTAAGETIGIALGAPTAVTVGSYKSLNVVTADTSSLTVNGQEGVDTFNVTGSAGPALIVEGGSPTAVGAGDILDVATAGGTTVNQGTTGDSGQVVSTNGTVNFVAIEGVQLHTAVAAGLTINGTNGDDAIDQTGTVVTVNNGAPVTMVSGYNALTLNGGNGDDVFNVNPATLLGTVATFTVNGGDPSASDKLIVNGRSATTDAINFAPTAADAGSVTITGFTGVGFTTVEQVTINGQGGGDTVAFTTPVSSTITLTPGATVDSGGVQVNSLVPVSFENIGSTGTVQFAQTGGGRGGTLIYEGTGNDDAFGVTAAGVISLNSQVNVTDAGAGVSAVTLDGGEGDDAFAVTNGYAYAGGIRLEGGDPSGSDSATLTTDAAGATAIVVNLNSGTVTGVGASTVTLSGVENVTVNGTVGADTAAVNQAGMVSEIENLTLNLDTSSASAVTLTGSAGDENFDVSPISATRTVTVVGGVTIDATQGSGEFTVDPGAGSDVVTVHGTASGETIAVNRAASTVLVGALKTVTLSAANTESLVVSAGAGDDTIAVTGAAGIPLIVDGGMPSGSDTLTVATSGAASVTIGATPDSGVVSSVTNGSVAFVGIEAITLTGDAGLTINGTNADNAINQSGGTVSVDDAAPVTFGGGGFTGLTLNGFAGDDVFNVNPATLPAGIATFTVSGGDPTAGDTLIVNGTSGGDAINFLPTSADAGGVAIAGDTTVTFDTTELVVINGLGGVDTLTVTTPAGANTVRYSPAQAADAGAVLVDSLVAMSFENIGSSGTVAMADAAPARSDSLVYDGTANNDAFGITAAGNITLAGHVTLTSAGANAGLSSVTLNGGDGDDTFAVAAGNPYTSIRLNGGDPSASDIAALTGDATAGTVTMDSGAATTTVAGAGLGTVTLTGVEIVNLTTTGTIGVNGTAANDSFTASPYSANGVEFALAGLNTVVNASTTAALTLDPVGGAGTVNGVTVNGTAAGETIGIALGAPTAVTVGSYKSLNVVTADTSSLTVNGQEGVDTFNVTGSAGPALIVEGGSPTAVGAGDILDVATAGGTTVNQGTTGDSGQVVSTNGTVNFVAIEGVQLHTAVAAGLTINGTNGDDAIDQTGTVVTVNNGAPVTMVSGYNALTLNGGNGDDVFNVNPATLLGTVATFTVNGGDPSASDKLIVNGRSATTDAINFAPTAADAGSVTITGFTGVGFTTVEQVTINGQGGGDTVAFTTPVSSTITLTPGATVDSGGVQVNSLVPVSFENIGSTGTVQFAQTGGGRGGTLIYEGTGNDDAFGVTAAGVISLNSQVNVTDAGAGVSAVTLDGGEGDDAFAVTNGYAYAGGIRLEGGDPSGSDSATLTTDAAGATAIVVNLNSGTVTGVGASTVTLSGVENVTVNGTVGADTAAVNQAGMVSEIENLTLNLDTSSASAVTLTGSAGDENFDVSPISATRTVTVVGGVTIDATQGSGAFTVDPGAGSDVVTVHGTASGETIAVNRAASTVLVGALKTVTLSAANTESLVVSAGAGDDTIAVTGAAGIPLIVDGGMPSGSDTLTVATSGAASVTIGATPDSGVVSSVTNGSVAFVGIEAITLTGDAGLTINGTNADNAINQSGGTVSVDDAAPVTFGGGGFTGLTLNGFAGDDVFNVNPATLPAGIATFTVSGGDPTAGDTLIVNGTSGGDAINFLPTSADAGGVAIAGDTTVTFDTTELVVINGLGGVDTLTVTTPAGANTVRYSPAQAADAGAVLVDSLVAMSFENIGSSGTVAMADAAPARSDSLVYDGTANNDAFGITAAGNITLAGHVTLTSAGANAGLSSVTLNGGDGDDTFAVAAGNPYTSIRLNGGDPSASDIAALTGDATAGTVTMDSGAATTTVAGAGLGTVTLTGVEIVNLTTTGTIGVNGTAANDSFTASPYSANGVEFALAGLNTVVNASTTAALTLDPVGGAGTVNGVTVNGTAAGETIGIALGAPTAVTVGSYKSLNVVTADTSSLTVNGQEGVDTFNVTGSAGPALIVEGGSPTAVGAGDILDVATAGPTTVNQGTTGDSGQVVSTNGTVNFVAIEGVQLHTAVAAGLTINGTNGDDAIDQTGTVVTVNNGAPVTMVSGYNALTLNGGNGDDVFNVNPATLLGTVATFTVNGGDPSASDKLIVNGRSATTDAINFAPTAADAGSVTITGFTGVGFTTVEQVTINGQGGNDILTVTGPLAANRFVVTAGDTFDDGSVLVNNTVPMNFLQLGAGGAVNTVGGAGVDTVVYNGTDSNDAFTVAATTGYVTLANLTGTHVVLQTGAVESLILNGLAGDDTFTVTAPQVAYTSITLDGGDPSASDIADLVGNGATTLIANLGDSSPTVTGSGLGTINLFGVEIVNATANGAVQVNGTSNDDSAVVSPLGANSGTVQINGVAPVLNYLATTAFTINLQGGANDLTVNGSDNAENITVTPTTVTVFGRLPVVYTAGNTQFLTVNGKAGDDIITVTPSAITPMMINGGDPIGSTPGDKLVIVAGGNPVTYQTGPHNDSGAFLVDALQRVSFTEIEGATVTGASSTTVIGTNGDDAITIIARDDSYDALANGVQDFTTSVNDSIEVLWIDVPTLAVNAMGGNDEITLQEPAPNEAVWNVQVSIDGGPPSASDTFVFQKPLSASAVEYRPTGSDAGNITVVEASPTTIALTGIENFIYDGEGASAPFTIFGTTSANTIVHNVGTGVDEGFFRVDNFLGVSYQDVGLSSVLTVDGVTNVSGSDTLLYDGTATDDNFTVVATTGVIDLDSYLPIHTVRVQNLTLDGLDGDNTFTVNGPQGYANITLRGGMSSGSDVATLNGSGPAMTYQVAAIPFVQGGGMANVNLQGIEDLFLNAGAGNITVTGTSYNENFDVSATALDQGQVTVDGIWTQPTIYTDNNGGTVTIDGGTGVNKVTVEGTPGDDSMVVSAAGVNTTVSVGIPAVQLTVTAINAHTQTLAVAGGAGNDSITVNGPVVPYMVVDGGTGRDSMTLNGGNATLDTYSVGPALGAGRSVYTSGGVTQTVDFYNLEPVIDAIPSPNLTVIATDGDNAIDYVAGALAGYGRVSVDGQEYVDFTNKTTLTINALGGNDVINLNNPNPANQPTGLTGITVNGGDPTDSDTLIVNGTLTGGTTAAADTIGVTPTAGKSDAGVVTVTGLATVTFATVENLVINGQGGGDTVTVTTPAGADTITYGPGPTADSSTAIISPTTGGVSLVPVTLTNLGTTGASVVLADAGAVRADNLIYNGTGGSDNFTVTAAGVITLNDQTPVSTPGVQTLRIQGQEGDSDSVTVIGTDGIDLYIVAPGGTSSGSPNSLRTNLLTDDPTTLPFTLNADNGFVMDQIQELYLQTGAGDDLVTVNDMTGTETSLVNIDLGTPGADGDAVNVNGTNAPDTVNVSADANNASWIDVRGLAARVRITDATTIDQLTVNGNEGNDRITSSLDAPGPLVTFNGGDGDDYLAATGTLGITMNGDDGNDTFVSGLGNDTIVGGLGTDRVVSSAFGDTSRNFAFTLSRTASGTDFTLQRQASSVTNDTDTLTGIEEAQLTGGTGNDTFNIGQWMTGTSARPFAGRAILTGGQGSDTLNVSTAFLPTVGTPAQDQWGFTVDLDLVNYDQQPTYNSVPAFPLAPILDLMDPMENFVGSQYKDKIFVDALAVPRSIDGGLPTIPDSANIPPGDELSVDGQDQFMTINRIVNGQPSADSGTATAFGYQPVTFTNIEKLDVTNNLGSTGFGDKNVTPYTRQLKYPTSTKKPTAVTEGKLVGNYLAPGWVDVVTSCKSNGKISVLLGKGNGTYQTAVVYNTGLTNVEDLVLADMNNDGFLDVVVSGKTNGPATYGKNRVMILDGNGDGTFAAPVQYITHLKGPTVNLAVADVDGDGFNDVMIAGKKEVRLLLNSGTGTLEPVQLVLSRGYDTTKIILKDITGDGSVDLVAANYKKNFVSTFVNNGSGVFGLPDPLHTNNRLADGNFFTAAANTYKHGKVPTSMAIADFNNDGLYDIVVSNKNGISISVLLGNPNATGNADAFITQIEPHYETRGYVAVAAGDLNGDGKQDLVMVKESYSDCAVVLLGDGNGAFSSMITVSFDDVEKRQPSAIAIGDLNNDGGLDILIANQGARNVSVLLKNPVI